MKKMSAFYLISFLWMTGISLLSACSKNQEQVHVPVQIQLLSSPWSFQAPSSPSTTLTVTQPHGVLPSPADTAFSVRFTIDLNDFPQERRILEIPRILRVDLRQHDPLDRKNQNYPAYRMPDGTVPVLEANLSLRLPVEDQVVKEMPIGIPLAMLENPEGKHEVVLHFSGVRWTLYIDGELLDNEFPLGYPVWEKQVSWKIDPMYVSQADFYSPALKPEKVTLHTPRLSPEIQYWTPPGHNTWVGDVATFFKDGRYHIFYLYDRRGHASKFGRGAHYFEHISTTDFKNWTEHPAATPIEEQWETFGTGTPFMVDGKFCISYGLHTTRIYPREMTTLPALWDYYEKHGVTGPFRIGKTPGFPAGSTYAISEDGVSNFRKTGILFHPCENPSVYTDPEGRLRMLANYGSRGTWESSSIDEGWYSVNPDFPPGGDCTFFFRWGAYDYIIGGFNGMWSKPAFMPETSFKDVVKEGLDFYNGMCVPAVTEISDGRFLLSGWMFLVNWGGCLLINELVQLPDGRIGTKWMEEIIPQTGVASILTSKLTQPTSFDVKEPSFMLTFDVVPKAAKNGRVGVTLLPEEGESNSCEWQLALSAKRAQYSAGQAGNFAGEEKTLREGGSPQGGRDYAIENLIHVEEPFTVRMIVKGSEKFGGSVIDTEIAQMRTMLTFRQNLTVGKILFRTEDVEVRNIKLAPLTH
ncbi:MAG: hypothetical protein LUG98_02170 [Tannerellaceae bacterium]|nr:hypothetical protein [Tannerellaceae bacterium]